VAVARKQFGASHTEYVPQLATLVSRPPRGEAWVHEIKFDGYRIGVWIDGPEIRLLSRRGNDWTKEFPEVVTAVRALGARRALIDGEVVMLDERGVASFQALQNRARSRKGLAYYAFDLLRLDDVDLTNQSLEDRKRRLRELLGDDGRVLRYSTHFDSDGELVFRRACELGAEGIVSKRRDAPYRRGMRHDDWQKSKCLLRQELVIGFTDPSGSREGVGSLLVGHYESGHMRFAGKVGTGEGWTAAFSRELRRRLQILEHSECPFDPPPSGYMRRNAHWVRPELIAEVEIAEWTAGGHIRQGRLRGFRTDKEPSEVTRERPAREVRKRHRRDSRLERARRRRRVAR
jgi:bifunctional non-homologous end joining protein LigD